MQYNELSFRYVSDQFECDPMTSADLTFAEGDLVEVMTQLWFYGEREPLIVWFDENESQLSPMNDDREEGDGLTQRK